MFNKAKDVPEEFDMPNDATDSLQQRRPAKSSGPSILGPDIAINGSVQCDGEVQLEGAVEGDIRAGSLTVGEDAAVKGEIEAETVMIRGHVSGSVKARHVQLASTARIEGDIIHTTLAIESGAYFEGNCRRADVKSSRPETKPAATSTTSTPPSSSSSSEKDKEKEKDKTAANGNGAESKDSPAAAKSGGGSGAYAS